MPTSTSRLAYEDCYEILDQALADDLGARVTCNSHSHAMGLRTRIHTARKLDRLENAKTYDKDHPMHGLSAYDKIVVKLQETDDEFYVILEKIQLNNKVESLSQVVEREQLNGPRSMKLINPPLPRIARRV